MPNLSRYRALAPRERVMVALGVLLDGHDAAEYLSYDKERHQALSRAAKDVAELAPEVRIPLLGTLIRSSLSELSANTRVKPRR